MARFIQVPAVVTVVDPVTGDPLPEAILPVWTWERSWRTVIAIVAQKGVADALALVDLRQKGCGKSLGDWIELTEDEYRWVEPEFRRPRADVLGVAWILGADAHQRAVLDAPTKLPVVVVDAKSSAAS